MSQMYCGRCHRFGIYWVGLGTLNEHTYCPHCYSINSQQPEDSYEDDEDENEL